MKGNTEIPLSLEKLIVSIWTWLWILCCWWSCCRWAQEQIWWSL